MAAPVGPAAREALILGASKIELVPDGSVYYGDQYQRLISRMRETLESYHPAHEVAAESAQVAESDTGESTINEPLVPVTCERCGRTMPRVVADDPDLHECAQEH